MAWIEAHQNLERHKKTKKLSRLMGWNLDETIGKLFRFWWWCVDYAIDGDLRKHNDDDIADSIGLNGDEGKKFVEVMVQSGWIDRDPYFRVHDWWDYIGLFLRRKYQDKDKQQKWQVVQQLYNNCTPTVRNLPTLPTKPTKPTIAESSSAQSVPKRIKKSNPAIKSVIDHICNSWEKKKKMKYPFISKHAKLIQYQCNRYEPAGVMALWDFYLCMDDPFVLKAGFSIEVFVTVLPRLADMGWKSLKQKYEKEQGLKPAGEVLRSVGL